MLKTITYTLLTAATFQMFSSVNDFHNDIPQPVQLKEDAQITSTKQALQILGRDLKHADSLCIAAKAGNIDPILFTTLIETESNFKIKCRSSKGYVGLGQTPVAIQRQGYEVVDLTLAACILKEKMIVAKGNTRLALALYKGGNNPMAKKQADEVLSLYHKVKTQMKG